MVALFEHLTNDPHIIVNGFQHAGIFTALGLLDDDTKLPDYGEMSTDSDYELSDFDHHQSQGECGSNLISDSGGDPCHSSHKNQPVFTKECLSVTVLLHVLKIVIVIKKLYVHLHTIWLTIIVD